MNTRTHTHAYTHIHKYMHTHIPLSLPISPPLTIFTTLYFKPRYSRVPVYRGDVDHIVGVVYSKDLLEVGDVPCL